MLRISSYVNLRWRTGYQAVSNTSTRLASVLEAELAQYDQMLPDRVQLLVTDLPQLGVLASLLSRVWLEPEQRHGLFQHSVLLGGDSAIDDGLVQAAFRVLYGPNPEEIVDALYNMASTIEYAQGRPFLCRLFLTPDQLSATEARVPVAREVMDAMVYEWSALERFLPAPDPVRLLAAKVDLRILDRSPTPRAIPAVAAPTRAAEVAPSRDLSLGHPPESATAPTIVPPEDPPGPSRRVAPRRPPRLRMDSTGNTEFSVRVTPLTAPRRSVPLPAAALLEMYGRANPPLELGATQDTPLAETIGRLPPVIHLASPSMEEEAPPCWEPPTAASPKAKAPNPELDAPKAEISLPASGASPAPTTIANGVPAAESAPLPKPNAARVAQPAPAAEAQPELVLVAVATPAPLPSIDEPTDATALPEAPRALGAPVPDPHVAGPEPKRAEPPPPRRTSTSPTPRARRPDPAPPAAPPAPAASPVSPTTTPTECVEQPATPDRPSAQDEGAGARPPELLLPIAMVETELSQESLAWPPPSEEPNLPTPSGPPLRFDLDVDTSFFDDETVELCLDTEEDGDPATELMAEAVPQPVDAKGAKQRHVSPWGFAWKLLFVITLALATMFGVIIGARVRHLHLQRVTASRSTVPNDIPYTTPIPPAKAPGEAGVKTLANASEPPAVMAVVKAPPGAPPGAPPPLAALTPPKASNDASPVAPPPLLDPSPLKPMGEAGNVPIADEPTEELVAEDASEEDEWSVAPPDLHISTDYRYIPDQGYQFSFKTEEHCETVMLRYPDPSTNEYVRVIFPAQSVQGDCLLSSTEGKTTCRVAANSFHTRPGLPKSDGSTRLEWLCCDARASECVYFVDNDGAPQ